MEGHASGDGAVAESHDSTRLRYLVEILKGCQKVIMCTVELGHDMADVESFAYRDNQDIIDLRFLFVF